MAAEKKKAPEAKPVPDMEFTLTVFFNDGLPDHTVRGFRTPTARLGAVESMQRHGVRITYDDRMDIIPSNRILGFTLPKAPVPVLVP